MEEQLREENKKLREVIRQQGEFIQSLREMIRDFVYSPASEVSLGRSVADRGLRPTRRT